jgi:hypothetical protein
MMNLNLEPTKSASARQNEMMNLAGNERLSGNGSSSSPSNGEKLIVD